MHVAGLTVSHGHKDGNWEPVQERSADIKVNRGTLVQPNLDGLWSTSLLPGSKDSLFQKCFGGFVLLCLTASWSLGATLPVYAAWLLWQEDAKILGTAILGFLAWPYVFPVKPWPSAARFWLRAAAYFDGGCSMSFEERVPNDLSIPQLNCYHPHGIFTLGLILNSGIRCSAADRKPTSERWRRFVGSHLGPIPLVGLAAEQLVQLPVFRHIMVLWTGNIESASKRNMLRKMNRGESFGLCPGGFHELTLFRRGHEHVFLKKKGFIYYALRHGYRVVPAYTFGESSTYVNALADWCKQARIKFADWGIPAILITGPCWWVPLLGLLPFGDGGLHTVHGTGRTFPKIDKPSEEQVEEYHAWYVKALEELFERHKQRFGLVPDQHLEVNI